MQIAWQVAIDRALMEWLERGDRSREHCRAIFERALDCIEAGPPPESMQSPTDRRRHLEVSLPPASMSRSWSRKPFNDRRTILQPYVIGDDPMGRTGRQA
jgi:hypothetical protein